MTRFLTLTLLSIFFTAGLAAQVDETVREMPPRAVALYPTLEDMYGYAIGEYEDYLMVFGGSIRSQQTEQYRQDFPNLDILLIDFKRQRASAYTNGQLEGALGEQMGATGLSYYQQGNTLFLIGGYGYSESQNQYVTFPYITAIDLKATLSALLEGKNPVASFYQICDERLAIFDGTLDYNGEEFFLINGKTAYMLRPFSEHPEYVEETLKGQARTFKLTGEGASLELEAFQDWYDMDAFEEYYGPLLPDRIREELEKSGQGRGRIEQ
jgi:hypothetical protein